MMMMSTCFPTKQWLCSDAVMLLLNPLITWCFYMVAFVSSQYKTYSMTIMDSGTSSKRALWLCCILQCNPWLAALLYSGPALLSQQDNGPINRWLRASVVLLVSALRPRRGHPVRQHTSGTMQLCSVSVLCLFGWLAQVPMGLKSHDVSFERQGTADTIEWQSSFVP